MGRRRFVVCLLVFSALAWNPACRKKEAPSAPKEVDLTNWKADPNLPKPDITATVAMAREPERKKISMVVTATEANGLTVHEVHFRLKYRTFDEATQTYVYPENAYTNKMIPVIKEGKTVYKTPVVEPQLRDKAWNGTDDNWEIEILQYNQYYK